MICTAELNLSLPPCSILPWPRCQMDFTQINFGVHKAGRQTNELNIGLFNVSITRWTMVNLIPHDSPSLCPHCCIVNSCQKTRNDLKVIRIHNAFHCTGDKHNLIIRFWRKISVWWQADASLVALRSWDNPSLKTKSWPNQYGIFVFRKNSRSFTFKLCDSQGKTISANAGSIWS